MATAVAATNSTVIVRSPEGAAFAALFSVVLLDLINILRLHPSIFVVVASGMVQTQGTRSQLSTVWKNWTIRRVVNFAVVLPLGRGRRAGQQRSMSEFLGD
jgi:hypothetical protein